MRFVGQGWRALAPAVLVALAAACESGGGGTQTPVATSVVATTATAQSALTGAAVAQAPAVRVTDQDGDPMQGVPVSFAVVGGGSVATPSATTDAAGVASAGSWTLGATAGTQTVTATAGSLAPVQFSATAQARVATTVTPISAATQTAATGAAVAQAPTVRVSDQAGQPLAGVTVSFAVTSGGGTVGSATSVTAANGTASSNRWTLGAAAGQNTVTATVAGLAAVTFTATGQTAATPPAAVVPVTATTQTGTPGAAVAQAPAVRVDNAAGQPLAGVTVTFAVTAGGGTLGQTSVVTNAAGTASAGSWTLGATAGQNTVTATVAGLPPVTFNATSSSAGPCNLMTPYALFSTVQGELATTDCHLPSGEYIDFYGTTLPTAQAVAFSLTSSAVDTWLEVYNAEGEIVAFNDDVAQGNSNSTARVFAPSGNYFLSASSYDPDKTGAYQLSSAGVSGNVNCEEAWVVPGVIVNGQVQSTDCDFGGFFTDEYLIILQPGQRLTVRMESSAVNSYLQLFDSNLNVVAEDDNGAGGNDAQITYTASSLALFLLDASTAATGASGAYTLTVTSN